MHRSNVVVKNNSKKQRLSEVVPQVAISEVFKGESMGKGIIVPVISSRCPQYYYNHILNYYYHYYNYTLNQGIKL